MSSLTSLALGQKAKIVFFDMNKKSLKRFIEMGLYVNKTIQILEKLPLGGNLVVLSDHGKYSLRNQEAQAIKVVATSS